jgi:hypothetical protein
MPAFAGRTLSGTDPLAVHLDYIRFADPAADGRSDA